MVKKGELTAKQKAFVEYYAEPESESYNNAYQSAIRAGYAHKTANNSIQHVLGNVGVQQAIEAYKAKKRSLHIASRQERQDFWTRVANGEIDGTSMSDRLRASELLGKSQADFVDRVEQITVDQSRPQSKAEQIEALRSKIKLLTDADDAGTALATG